MVLKASLSAALIDALSATLVDVMPTSWARKRRARVERFCGADSEEARTVAAPYSTEAADAAADAELGLGQGGLVDLARETGDEVGYAEGFAPRTTPSGRRTPSRRCAGRVADALLGPAPGPAPRASARTGARASARAGTRTDARVYA